MDFKLILLGAVAKVDQTVSGSFKLESSVLSYIVAPQWTFTDFFGVVAKPQQDLTYTHQISTIRFPVTTNLITTKQEVSW